MNKAVVIGAGKTGRGFIGRLLREAGQEILFIDKNADLVERLNAQGGFDVYFFGNSRPPFHVSGYQACTWETADIKDTELILVSVGGQNLRDVGMSLREKLDPGKQYYIITAENASHPSQTLREMIDMPHVFVSESTVFCTTIERDGLDIDSEDYPYLQFDVELLGGYEPEAKQLRPIKGFADFLQRKLYTYNAASCVIAYNGWIKGYTNYADAANDPEILRMLDENYVQTNRALCLEYNYDPNDQSEFALLSRKKFLDRTIVDTIARNARDPARKLAAGERIIGPMRLISKYGGDSTVLERTCAAAIKYLIAEDKEQTPDHVLLEICKLKSEDPLYQRIVAALAGI